MHQKTVPTRRQSSKNTAIRQQCSVDDQIPIVPKTLALVGMEICGAICSCWHMFRTETGSFQAEGRLVILCNVSMNRKERTFLTQRFSDGAPLSH